ncbi:TPA: spermidine/putrescine ABC transporter permease [Candidatus Dependentiae bacterium]|nr:spermidine/putrescine ABC transporter permease [Candidatus Dependentiae bacterium]
MNMKKLFLPQIPFFLGIPALVWQVLFVYVPLVFILVLSVQSGTFESFRAFFTAEYGLVLMRSLFLGLSTATICLILAYPVAYWIALCAGRWKNFLLFLLFIPFWTNFLLHIYAWMFVMDRNGAVNTVLQWLGLIQEPLHLLHTTASVFVVMVYCYTPFMIWPIYSALEKFDVRLHEASSDLGATWWQTLWRIVIPLSLPGIRSGFFLVLVPAFGEFVIPELIGGDKVMFAGGVVSYYTLHAKTSSFGAAFTIITSCVLCLVLCLIYLLSRRLMRHVTHRKV